MMTATALIAVVASLILTQNETIKEIMIILVVGLLFDIINTWLQNAAMLRYYVEKMLPRKATLAAEKEQRKFMRDYTDAKKMGAQESQDSDLEEGPGEEGQVTGRN
jgi:predicted RND superfamily exporter protein